MSKGPRLPQFKFNNLFTEHFSWLIFFRSLLPGKNWQGGGELLLKNGTIDGYWLCILTMLFPGRIYIALGPWHFGDFRNIFLPDIGEDQIKVLPFERGAQALCHMVNSTLVIALCS